SEYARAPDINLQHFNLDQLVSEVAELYRLQDPSIGIRLDLAPTLPELEADRGRVRQILANLITNGLEALQGVPNGSLEVSTREMRTDSSSSIMICVRDNGPGFRTEILGRVFDPYVTGKPKGTGLGLAIVKRIVEEHGGRIEAENGPEGGARILVFLPISAQDRTVLAGERRMELRRERA
ncbi:MAG TPA: ATP-binding protein, partial [Steroidobacteraceae bacterium]|nr:ATP-binding protein [Steroidobacteraceae bacterium]